MTVSMTVSLTPVDRLCYDLRVELLKQYRPAVDYAAALKVTLA